MLDTAIRMESPARFLGSWTIVVQPTWGPRSTGTAHFERLPGNGFILQRWSFDQGDAPGGVAVIGADASGEGYLLHHFDARGIARVYLMDSRDGTWSLERSVGDFSPLVYQQRFRGAFSDDGARFDGVWERSVDGVSWAPRARIGYGRFGSPADDVPRIPRIR